MYIHLFRYRSFLLNKWFGQRFVGGVQIFAEYSDQVQRLCDSGSRRWGEQLGRDMDEKRFGERFNIFWWRFWYILMVSCLCLERWWLGFNSCWLWGFKCVCWKIKVTIFPNFFPPYAPLEEDELAGYIISDTPRLPRYLEILYIHLHTTAIVPRRSVWSSLLHVFIYIYTNKHKYIMNYSNGYLMTFWNSKFCMCFNVLPYDSCMYLPRGLDLWKIEESTTLCQEAQRSLTPIAEEAVVSMRFLCKLYIATWPKNHASLHLSKTTDFSIDSCCGPNGTNRGCWLFAIGKLPVVDSGDESLYHTAGDIAVHQQWCRCNTSGGKLGNLRLPEKQSKRCF